MTISSSSTASFLLQYDAANLARPTGDACLAALAASGERDFGTLVAVFAGTRPKTPINVTVRSGVGGVNDGQDMTIGCGNASASGPFDQVRNTFIAELSEIFMAAQRRGWNPGDSKGEALSRALGGVMYPDGQQPGFTVHQWIDNDPDPALDPEATTSPSGRQNWISKTFTGNEKAPGDIPAKSTGCGLAFLFYLNRQLGFSWARIVSANHQTFDGVYQQLTGSGGTFQIFIAAIDGEFPAGSPSELNGSNMRPFSDGLEQSSTPNKRAPRALLSPNGLNPSPLRTPGRLSLRGYMGAVGLGSRMTVRWSATQAALAQNAPSGPVDPLSRISVRGLVNGRRSAALL